MAAGPLCHCSPAPSLCCYRALGLLPHLTRLVLLEATARGLEDQSFPSPSETVAVPSAFSLEVTPADGVAFEILHVLARWCPLPSPIGITWHSREGLPGIAERDFAVEGLQAHWLVSFLTSSSFKYDHDMLFSLADDHDVDSYLAALEDAAAVEGPHGSYEHCVCLGSHITPAAWGRLCCSDVLPGNKLRLLDTADAWHEFDEEYGQDLLLTTEHFDALLAQGGAAAVKLYSLRVRDHEGSYGEALVVAAGSSLRVLDISDAVAVGDQGLRALARGGLKLTYVMLYGVERVTAAGVVQLLEESAVLEHLHLTFVDLTAAALDMCNKVELLLRAGGPLHGWAMQRGPVDLVCRREGS
jgi:hypothetical protein